MRSIVLMLVLGIAGCTDNPGWVKIDDRDTITVYIDPATIRREENRVRMWSMSDHKTAQVTIGKRHLSQKTQSEFDCKNKRVRLLYFSWHSDNMGNGQIVHVDDYDNKPGPWESVLSGSVGESQWKFVCGKQ